MSRSPPERFLPPTLLAPLRSLPLFVVAAVGGGGVCYKVQGGTGRWLGVQGDAAGSVDARVSPAGR
jgi:hypothetical protein